MGVDPRIQRKFDLVYGFGEVHQDLVEATLGRMRNYSHRGLDFESWKVSSRFSTFEEILKSFNLVLQFSDETFLREEDFEQVYYALRGE